MDKNEKSNLKRLNNVIKNNSIKIIVVILLFILFGYFYSYNMVIPKYKSISTIVLTSDNVNNKGKVDSVTQSDLTLNKSLIATYRKILKSSKVLNQVIGNLNLKITEDELYKNIEIEEVKDTQIIQVGVTSTDAKEAQRIAEELNRVFIEEVKQIYKMENISVVDKASLETQPYNIHHMVDILMFFIAGIICSVIMIFIIYILDSTIKIEQDIEEYVKINVVGAIPLHKSTNRKRELIVQSNGKSVISEAFKAIRTNISFSKLNTDSKTILFTSSNAGEGKSWIASNIAVAYAWSNKNVILVDADMRKGRQHNIFKVSNKGGLSDCLTMLEDREDYQILQRYIRETSVPKVHIMTIGTVPPNPSELLSSSKMNELIDMLKCVYDIVIIDGTPCNLVTDSIPLSRIVDSTILVTESRRTKIEELRNVVKLIGNVGGNIEGAILNKKKVQNKEYGNGYYYEKSDYNVALDLETKTVKELIDGRKEYGKTKKENEVIEEQDKPMIELAKKLEDLEGKIIKLPDMNWENYSKVVEEIRRIYENEIDKNKLAENIKENIIKNELVKKLEESSSDTKRLFNQKIEQLNYETQIENLIHKIDSIEKSINQHNSKEEIIEMISELSKEQKKNVQELDNSKFLSDILDRLEEMQENQNNKLDYIKTSQEQKIEDTHRETRNILTKEIENIDYKEELSQLMNKIANIENIVNENVKVEQLNGLVNQLNNMGDSIEQKDIDMKLNSIKDIISDSAKLQDIKELAETQAKFNQAIEKIKEENDKKMQKIDSTAEIKEIMKELKKINNRYDKLAEKINQNTTVTKKKSATQMGKAKTTMKNNVIELEEAKRKLEHEELIIEYGEEITYEQLLSFAVDIYDIDPKTSILKRRAE